MGDPNDMDTYLIPSEAGSSSIYTEIIFVQHFIS